MRKRFGYFPLSVALVLVCTLLAGCAASTPALRVKVIDSATDAPIQDVEVGFAVYAREGTFTGHGGRIKQQVHVVRKTGADGVAELPRTEFDPRAFGWFGSNTNNDGAHLYARKPGFKGVQWNVSQRPVSLQVEWRHSTEVEFALSAKPECEHSREWEPYPADGEGCWGAARTSGSGKTVYAR